MSKIGKQSVCFDKTVEIVLSDNNSLNVKGPKGELSMDVSDSLNYSIADGKIDISPKKVNKATKQLWGTTRALINNMVIGVTECFTKKLQIVGVGYKSKIEDNMLVLSLGFCHDIAYVIPENLKITCNKNIIEVTGCDKQLVGQVASELRSLRKPEPYKGKGIMYEGENIIRKEGKKK